MKLVMRATIAIVGIFNLFLGFAFLLDPARLARQFALVPVGTQGMATLRADFPAFFLTGAVFALIGAWRADPKPLIVPLALLGTALTGRFVAIALDGTAPTTLPPMVAEGLMIVALLVALRVFGRPVS